MRRVFLLLATVVLVGACATDPRGTRLVLPTALGQSHGACSFVLAAPFRIARDDGQMIFVNVATGEDRYVVWPDGFAAWLEFGKAVLYASDGTVVGREGAVLDNIGGAEGAGFRVCSVGARTYQ